VTFQESSVVLRRGKLIVLGDDDGSHSAVHWIVQSPPSVNLSPGPGAVGMISAKTKGRTARAARKKRDMIKS